MGKGGAVMDKCKCGARKIYTETRPLMAREGFDCGSYISHQGAHRASRPCIEYQLAAANERVAKLEAELARYHDHTIDRAAMLCHSHGPWNPMRESGCPACVKELRVEREELREAWSTMVPDAFDDAAHEMPHLAMAINAIDRILGGA